MFNGTSWLELNSSALAHNINQYKHLIGNAQLGFVVKANAYGHGFNEIIHLTKKHSAIDWYCTATVSEALTIRKLGSDKPILVMCTIDQDPLIAIKQNIDLVIYDRIQLQAVIHVAKLHKRKARIHIKIDTGLSRFGFLPKEALSLIKQLIHKKSVIVRGIITHFAAAEEPDSSYTDWQMGQFTWLINELKQHRIAIPFVHSHASSAVIRRGLEQTNFVRVGAGIYGLWPSNEIRKIAQETFNMRLCQIATWKTTISSIRTIEQNSPVGYGRTCTTTRKTTIGLLPVGYADGYHRRLSNIGTVLVDGMYAPVIGRTAMNIISIDITDISSVDIGSEVVLMGDYPGLTAYDLAQRIDSYNPREITTRLSAMIPRRIVHSKKIHLNKNNEARHGLKAVVSRNSS